MRRDRGNDNEPLHVVIQCEDLQGRAQEKMKNAVEAINQLLHPPVRFNLFFELLMMSRCLLVTFSYDQSFLTIELSTSPRLAIPIVPV